MGINHLRTEPTIAQTINSNIEKAVDFCTSLAGFYIPEKKLKIKVNISIGIIFILVNLLNDIDIIIKLN